MSIYVRHHHDRQERDIPSALIFALALLLPPTDEQVFVSVRLVQSPLHLAHLAPRVKHLPLELDRFELHAFALLHLNEERMGGEEVVPQADQPLEVLLVRPARLARRLDVSSPEANVGVVLVRLVVLFASETSLRIGPRKENPEEKRLTSSWGMMGLPPRALLRCRQCGYTSFAYGRNLLRCGFKTSLKPASKSFKTGRSETSTCAIGAF